VVLDGKEIKSAGETVLRKHSPSDVVFCESKDPRRRKKPPSSSSPNLQRAGEAHGKGEDGGQCPFKRCCARRLASQASNSVQPRFCFIPLATLARPGNFRPVALWPNVYLSSQRRLPKVPGYPGNKLANEFANGEELFAPNLATVLKWQLSANPEGGEEA
jgi:hypothetical protein